MSRTPDADGWISLSDAQWTNIVNHDHAYQSMSKDDAVHLAVKMTEAKCRELNVDAKAVAKLRDEFAAKALPAAMTICWADIGYPPVDGLNDIQQNARLAYKLADAMIAERAK